MTVFHLAGAAWLACGPSCCSACDRSPYFTCAVGSRLRHPPRFAAVVQPAVPLWKVIVGPHADKNSSRVLATRLFLFAGPDSRRRTRITGRTRRQARTDA